MSEGRKPLEGNDEWCADYHCAGDCGMRGHGYQHQYRELEDDPEQQEWVISGLDDANDETLTQKPDQAGDIPKDKGPTKRPTP